MEFTYIDEIVSQLLDDSFSVFCGAGATADVTKMNWEDIFSKETQEFYHMRFSDDLYFLADLEREYYNKEHFYDNVTERLTVEDETHSEHIDAVVNLNINQFWTTNYDNLIERNIYRKFGIRPTVIKESKDLFVTKFLNNYVVYKLNGCISEQKSMVLTKSDYFNYFKKERLLFEQLKRQLVLDTFLFIGYSFKDDLVLNALREIQEIFSENGKHHYRFVKREYPSSDMNAHRRKEEFDHYEHLYFEQKYNIKTIDIDTYAEIDIYLKEVYRRFCNHNVLICGSFRTIDAELRYFIERIVGELVFQLYKNKYNIYSGNGRGLGEIILAQTNKYQRKIGGKFVTRPLIFTGDTNEDKEKKNQYIIKDCHTMIIICGQDESLSASKNVIKQYKQFLQKADMHTTPLVIPIPATEYAAKKIFFETEFITSSTYQANQEVFERLKVCNSPEEIGNLVINMILSHTKEPNS